MSRDVLPDTDPVDEHLRRVGAPAGIASAGTGDREVNYRKERVTGCVELPVGQRVGRHSEVRLRAVGVVEPKAHPCVTPLDSPRVPPTVRRDGVTDVFSAVQFRVDGGSGRPTAVAVPLHDVDFATVDRAVVGQIPGRPGAGGETVQFDPGFPGGVDASSVLTEELAAVVGIAVLGGTDHEIGLAVEEEVAPIVAVLADVLG